MNSIEEAAARLNTAWPFIADECCDVLGSELHYQAMVYHGLRSAGKISAGQIGMNVKMWIESPVTAFFQALDLKKNSNYQGGFEPIPDVCLFDAKISRDWRRRNFEKTLRSLLLAIEVKASERHKGRLRAGEIVNDIKKLAAHRDEAIARGGNFMPCMMVIDAAPLESERMTPASLESSLTEADKHGVQFLYASKGKRINTLNPFNTV